MDERFRRALAAAGFSWLYGGPIDGSWYASEPDGRGAVHEKYLLALCRAYAGEWQPIETAPKDGTPVIAFMPTYYQGAGGQAVVMYMDWSDRPGWYSHVASKHDPTHWRPLPEPPHD